MNRIVCMRNGRNRNQTEGVFSDGRTIQYDHSAEHMLDSWCMQNGSDMRGRIISFRHITGCRQKPAVLISERTQIIYFPTLSAKNPDCTWICFNEVFRFHSTRADQTMIQFASGIKVMIDVNYRIVRNQMNRCRNFLNLLNSAYSSDLVQTEAMNGIMNRV